MSRTILRKVARPALAEEIRAIRAHLGLIQEEFAQRLEVAHSTIRNWESGRTRPNRRMLAKIRGLVPLPASPDAAKKQGGKWSAEIRAAAHGYVDMIFDRSTSSALVEKMMEKLGEWAARFASERD